MSLSAELQRVRLGEKAFLSPAVAARLRQVGQVPQRSSESFFSGRNMGRNIDAQHTHTHCEGLRLSIFDLFFLQFRSVNDGH